MAGAVAIGMVVMIEVADVVIEGFFVDEMVDKSDVEFNDELEAVDVITVEDSLVTDVVREVAVGSNELVAMVDVGPLIVIPLETAINAEIALL